jgi:hypothetical protein
MSRPIKVIHDEAVFTPIDMKIIRLAEERSPALFRSALQGFPSARRYLAELDRQLTSLFWQSHYDPPPDAPWLHMSPAAWKKLRAISTKDD